MAAWQYRAEAGLAAEGGPLWACVGAWRRHSTLLAPASRDLLTKVLMLHVVPGTAVPSSAVTSKAVQVSTLLASSSLVQP